MDAWDEDGRRQPLALSFAFPVVRWDSLDWRVTACFGLSQALSLGTWSFSLQKSQSLLSGALWAGLGDGAGKSHAAPYCSGSSEST